LARVTSLVRHSGEGWNPGFARHARQGRNPALQASLAVLVFQGKVSSTSAVAETLPQIINTESEA